MKNYAAIMLIVAAALLAAGCSAPEKKIYDGIEQSATKEKEFEKQQKPLADLEVKEKALFDEMMNLGMKDFDKITELSDKALANLEQRKKLLDKEKKAIDASESDFNKLDFANVKDEKLKKDAAALKKTMDERYKVHDQLYDSYLKGLTEDKKIYELMKNKDLELDELTKQIESSNKAYEQVMQKNEQFNELTEKFNKDKIEFYQKAGIETEEQSGK